MARDEVHDYATATAHGLVADLAQGRVSSAELCEKAIDQIERLDPPINAVVVRDFDRARVAARAADEALARGERAPLLGLPMTVKEAHNVAGLPTTWGVEAFKGYIADTDSVGVARLKAAGAVILGKTNVPPFLADWQSANPVYGRTNNPLDLSRSPGGSSGGGAAALAAGMVPLEFGSDIGGSIRVPAGFCGVWGHKPSYGLVPQRGHAPPGLDGVDVVLGVVGPMARDPADLELALSVLAGPAGLEATGCRLALPAPRHEALADFRVLLIESHPLARVAEEIRGALHATAARLEAGGGRVARSSEAVPDLAGAHQLYMGLLITALSRGAAPDGLPPAGVMSAHDWMNALDAQLSLRRQWARLFEDFDVVLAPTLGVVAFEHVTGEWAERTLTIDGVETPFADQLAWPGMATVANLPVTAAPIGTTRPGLPIGMQIIGPYLEDRTPLAFARLLAGL
ncbi:MAG TPA: amidase family protein [Caulobacteraceae bacterium]|nr:amidase family protein [Caulobacteraceae bacterium]